MQVVAQYKLDTFAGPDAQAQASTVLWDWFESLYDPNNYTMTILFAESGPYVTATGIVHLIQEAWREVGIDLSA